MLVEQSCHTSELPYVFQAMDVIRANYSTLSSYAQAEAPSAPSYPYSDIFAAYRGALEAFESHDDGAVDRETTPSVKKEEQSNQEHTQGFQRILTHFFGDYFKEDADEEIASDMAERWANFARGGNPNYEGSRAEWIPWRFHPDESEDSDWSQDGEQNPWVTDGEYDYWSDFELSDIDEDVEISVEDIDEITRDKQRRAYRRRALAALNMEVVDEDGFRTELRRATHHGSDGDLDKSFLASKLLFQRSLRDESPRPSMSKRAVREIIQTAQEMGVLGNGLSGEDGHLADGFWDDDFFPELFELRWPPEGRLIERDCTCDMWDKIRCKC